MFTARDLKEFLNKLPDKYLDYILTICLVNDHDLDMFDWLEQIQFDDNKKRVIFHSDYTCHCAQDGIYSCIDENDNPIFLDD